LEESEMRKTSEQSQCYIFLMGTHT